MVAVMRMNDESRYARCIDASRRVRWEIDRDVIRGRKLDMRQKFLPDNLSLVNQLAFLSDEERLLLSQIQGRTYAGIFGLVERFINAKVLELSSDYWLGDQVALEALIRFSDEELKHQELFRRMEALAAAGMPDGYVLTADADAVAGAVLGKSTWAVLALTCHIEIFTQVHYRKSIEPAQDLSALWKDVFHYHWKEESQHAILDELEWRREDSTLTREERDRAVSDFIELVAAIDGILQRQAQADAGYFVKIAGRAFHEEEVAAVVEGVLNAYRWQYIVSGVQDGRFMGILTSMLDEKQGERIAGALAPLM